MRRASANAMKSNQNILDGLPLHAHENTSDHQAKGFDSLDKDPNSSDSSDHEEDEPHDDENEDENEDQSIDVIEMQSRKLNLSSPMSKKRSLDNYMRTEVHDTSNWTTTRAITHPQTVDTKSIASSPHRVLGDRDGSKLKPVRRRKRRRRKSVHNYENECGYWLVKLFQGRSLSRIIKRRLLHYLIFQIAIGMTLMIITGQEGKHTKEELSRILSKVIVAVENAFPGSKYFIEKRYGASLKDLMHFASIPSFVLGVLTIPILSYWQSLHTNIPLLIKLLKLYFVLDAIAIIGILWCILVLFLTFSDVKSWNVRQP
jgi:hypothetical protein